MLKCKIEVSEMFFNISLIVLTFCLLTSLCQVQQESESDFIVETTQGLINGTKMKLKSGREIYAFLGIRYAQPPIGDLRFSPPVPVDAHSDILNAHEYGAHCIQRDTLRRSLIVTGDEDCLFLNVYTPELNSSAFLPVLFMIHGGGFLSGSGNWLKPDFLLEHNMVLVTINYRLGALGFLSMNDRVISGNFGLKDQVMALHWVQNNIIVFGGDPLLVTIAGHGAGAISVTLMLTASKTIGLYHKAIAFSGTLHSPWALTVVTRHIRHARHLARIFGCHTESSTKMKHCLKRVSAEDLVDATCSFVKWDIDPAIIFNPALEDPDFPDSLIVKSPHSNCEFDAAVPLWIGLASHADAIRVPELINNSTKLEEFNADFKTLAPFVLGYNDVAFNVQKINYRIKKFYFDDKPITVNHKWELIQMFTDYWTSHPLTETVECFKSVTNKTIYFYMLSYKGSASLSKLYGDYSLHGDYGVVAGDELLYLFPLQEDLFPKIERTPDDIIMVEMMTTMVYNFIRMGDPTPQYTKLVTDRWLPLYNMDIQYYDIGQEKSQMKTGLYAERIKLWAKIKKDTSLAPRD